MSFSGYLVDKAIIKSDSEAFDFAFQNCSEASLATFLHLPSHTKRWVPEATSMQVLQKKAADVYKARFGKTLWGNLQLSNLLRKVEDEFYPNKVEKRPLVSITEGPLPVMEDKSSKETPLSGKILPPFELAKINTNLEKKFAELGISL